MKNQLIAAREGKITRVMQRVARDEGIDRNSSAVTSRGKATILANNRHKDFTRKALARVFPSRSTPT
jgi:thiamine biosynthesis protein ThiC